MKKLSRWLSWLDNNLIKILLLGFIFLIPLYPKLPLKMINYTYVALRLEDLYVAFLVAIFFVQLWRKKIVLNKTFFIIILLFWLSISISFLWAYFIQKTIILAHLGFLNSARRIEYMIVFFIVTSSVSSKKDFYFYLNFIMFAFFLVAIYGVGQKFLGWPAVQTMNPEYAKGYLLVLDANARISSTFAGHYDLAGYLVLLIPIVLASFIAFRNKCYFFLFFLALSNLVLTASRVSYIAYLVSVIPFLIFIRKPKLLVVVLIMTGVLTFLSGNLTKRLKRTFQEKKIFINKTTSQITIPRNITPDDLPVGDFVPARSAGQNITSQPINQANLEAADLNLIKKELLEQIRQEARKTGKVLTKDQEDEMIDNYLKNLQVATAIIPDISFATRLQVEWPRAIKAFLRYPVFGKGPSTITEATDNDYLRWLGEFGIIGTSIFLYLLFSIMKTLWKFINQIKIDERLIYIGYLFGLFGLLINATYIDVFEASKIAYQFWFITGLFIGSIQFYKIDKNKA